MAAPGCLAKGNADRLAGFGRVCATACPWFDSSDSLEIPPAVVMIARRHYRNRRHEDPLYCSADPDHLETWARYGNGLCGDCQATCCTLPVEVRIDDLIRLEVVDASSAMSPRSRSQSA